MTVVGQATILIDADTRAFSGDVEKSVEGAAGPAASKFGGAFKGALAGVGTALVAQKAFAFLGDGIAEAVDKAEVDKRVETLIKNAGLAAQGVTPAAFGGVAAEIGKTLVVDDDDVKAAIAPLLQIPNLSKPALQEYATIVADVSAGSGKDLGTIGKAVALMGQDVSNSTRALKAAGVDLPDSILAQAKALQEAGKAGEAQNLILGELEKRYGGSAKAAGDAAGPQQKFGVALADLKESIGTALLPILSGFADVLAKALGVFNNLPGPVQTIVVAVLGFAAAAAVLAPLIGGIATVLPIIGTALAAITGPIGLVVLAIVGLAIVVVKNWDTIKDAFGKAIDFIKGVFSGVVDFIKDHAAQIGAVLLGIITLGLAPLVILVVKNWDSIKEAFATAARWIGDRIGDIIGFFTGLPEKVGGLISGLADKVGAVVDSVVGFFTGLPGRILAGIDSVVSTVADGVGRVVGFFAGLPGRATDALGDIGGKIGGIFKGAFDSVTSAGASAAGSFKEHFDSMRQTVADGEVGIGDHSFKIRDVLLTIVSGGLFPLVKGFIDHFDQIKGVLGTVNAFVLGVVSSMIASIASFVGSVVSFFAGLASTVAGGIGSAVSAVAGFVSNIIGFVGSIPGAIVGFIGSVFSAAVGIGRAIFDGITGFLGGIATFISTSVRNGINVLIGIINGLLRTISNVHISLPRVDWGPLHFGGQTLGIPLVQVPFLEHGGIVRASSGGTLAMLGEGGRDEAVLPLTGGLTEALARLGRGDSTSTGPMVGNLVVNGATTGGAYATGLEVVHQMRAERWRHTGR